MSYCDCTAFGAEHILYLSRVVGWEVERIFEKPGVKFRRHDTKNIIISYIIYSLKLLCIYDDYQFFKIKKK